MNKSKVVIAHLYILDFKNIFFFFLLTHQNHPSDKPTECSLVKPTLNKIDVEGLKLDINKFREHCPEQAFCLWSDWQNNLDKLVTVSDTWEWPLDALVSAEREKPFTADQSIPPLAAYRTTGQGNSANKTGKFGWAKSRNTGICLILSI